MKLPKKDRLYVQDMIKNIKTVLVKYEEKIEPYDEVDVLLGLCTEMENEINN